MAGSAQELQIPQIIGILQQTVEGHPGNFGPNLKLQVPQTDAAHMGVGRDAQSLSEFGQANNAAIVQLPGQSGRNRVVQEALKQRTALLWKQVVPLS